MPLSGFRLSPDQSDRSVVTVLADECDVRAIAQIARGVIEDAFPKSDYLSERLTLVERNLDILGPLIQSKFDAHRYRSEGDNKWISIGHNDLGHLRLRQPPAES
jgi:hypothetical protein